MTEWTKWWGKVYSDATPLLTPPFTGSMTVSQLFNL